MDRVRRQGSSHEAGTRQVPHPSEQRHPELPENTGFLELRRIMTWLNELREKAEADVVVMSVPSLDGENVASFAHRHAESWALGQKGKALIFNDSRGRRALRGVRCQRRGPRPPALPAPGRR